jgi:hypothetical protein
MMRSPDVAAQSNVTQKAGLEVTCMQEALVSDLDRDTIYPAWGIVVAFLSHTTVRNCSLHPESMINNPFKEYNEFTMFVYFV